MCGSIQSETPFEGAYGNLKRLFDKAAKMYLQVKKQEMKKLSPSRQRWGGRSQTGLVWKPVRKACFHVQDILSLLAKFNLSVCALPLQQWITGFSGPRMQFRLKYDCDFALLSVLNLVPLDICGLL